MFFLYNLERRVTLHPSYFGRNMHDLVTTKLVKDVEGTCAGNYYIICIMDTFDVSEGRILPGSGLAEFTVGYRAVVWRPFKGEAVGCSSRESPWSATKLTHHAGRCYRLLCEPPWVLRSGRASQALRVISRMRSLHPTLGPTWIWTPRLTEVSS